MERHTEKPELRRPSGGRSGGGLKGALEDPAGWQELDILPYPLYIV